MVRVHSFERDCARTSNLGPAPNAAPEVPGPRMGQHHHIVVGCPVWPKP